MKFPVLLFLSLLYFPFSIAQSLTTQQAEQFITLLFSQSDKLNTKVHPKQSEEISRLGITYRETKFKFLIGNDFDTKLKQMVTSGDISYQYQIIGLDSGYSKLSVTLPAVNSKKDFYFQDSLLILQPYYFSHVWHKIQSEYCIIHLSDTTLINPYAVQSLDGFIEKSMKLMKFNSPAIEQLKKEKIHYYLCKDDDEFSQLTANNAKGLYNLAGDYIISQYNNHFHEILHLLMNYRIKNPYLYTQPFFQEGFAVGYGGRGGLAAEPVLDMGAFIWDAGYIEDTDLLSKRRFQSIDPSISYPASGYLNVRLIQKIGFTQYLNLYQRYSESEEKVASQLIKKRDILFDELKKEYALSRFDQIAPVKDTTFISLSNTVKIGSFGVVKSDSIYYYFYIRNQMLIKTDSVYPGYKSKLFSELVPVKDYRGEKYLIRADENEVAIYNLFTNTLIANYVKSFSGEANVKYISLRYFKVPKKLFDESPVQWRVN